MLGAGLCAFPRGEARSLQKGTCLVHIDGDVGIAAKGFEDDGECGAAASGCEGTRVAVGDDAACTAQQGRAMGGDGVAALLVVEVNGLCLCEERSHGSANRRGGIELLNRLATFLQSPEEIDRGGSRSREVVGDFLHGEFDLCQFGWFAACNSEVEPVDGGDADGGCAAYAQASDGRPHRFFVANGEVFDTVG